MPEKNLEQHFFSLSDNDLAGFACSLREGSYEIELVVPGDANCPDGLLVPFTRVETYRYIFDEVASSFSYFSLKYEFQNRAVHIPLGVFGIAQNRKLHFPLLISSVGREFLMMPFHQFAEILRPVSDRLAIDAAYHRVLDARRILITKIFRFYYCLDSAYNPVMSWSAKGEKSPTRTVAQELGFIRTELSDEEGKKEFYFGKPFDRKVYEFVIECSQRWFSVFRHNKTNIAFHSNRSLNEELIMDKLRLFYLHLSIPAGIGKVNSI